MLARRSPRCAAILVAFGALVCARPVTAQTFDLENDRVQMTELKGLWRFHTGDDPRWADPSFDDSSWALLRSDTDWGSQGYKGYGGLAWYRFRVRIPAKHPPLALFVPGLAHSYEIFANGHLIGEVGRMPPHPLTVLPSNLQIAIPDKFIPSSQPTVFAIRVWFSPYFASMGGGGPWGAARIGDSSVLSEWKALQVTDLLRAFSFGDLLLVFDLLAAVAGFAVFSLRPTEREYLWFAVFELSTAAYLITAEWSFFKPVPVSLSFVEQVFLSAVGNVAFLLFVMAVIRGRRGWLFWMAFGSNIVCLPAVVAGQGGEWISIGIMLLITTAAFLLYAICVPLLLVRGARRGDVDAHLLLYPAGLDFGVNIVALISATLYLLGLTHSDWFNNFSSSLIQRPVPISLQNLADFLQQLGILAILVLRFARSRRDEQRMAGELESARAVQQILIPEEIPAIAGFRIACVYRPASEVGGDFFQIIPMDDGGVLVAIGDVSGKGMPAAMTVSLLVGTLRTLAHYTESPGEILARMNQRMLGRGDGGFTTCLVLRMSAEGAGTLANAGHLAPYIDGEEISASGGLPLGLDARSRYSEAGFRLAAKSQLTLVTDGVVEARNQGGELFGFERTASVAAGSAESIALAAQEFGQQDDITVLTLVCDTVTAAAEVYAGSPTLLPA